MNLAYQSLLMLVLLVTGTVAVLPLSLRGTVPPTLRSQAPAPVYRGTPLWLVESPNGQWRVNGDLVSSKDVGRLLQRRSRQQRVHYLPSDALPFERVSRSMRWLKTHSPASVVLELPPGARQLSP
jgi:hypothetical protein